MMGEMSSAHRFLISSVDKDRERKRGIDREKSSDASERVGTSL
jgi:hypothetical protein